MKIAISFCAFALVGCLAGTNVSVPEVIRQCSPAPASLQGTVEDALRGKNFRSILSDLAIRQGSTAVFCVVRDIQRQLSKAGASAEATYEPVVLDAATTYLNESNVKFED